MQQTRLLVIAGTRPELIKLAPLVRALRAEDTPLVVETCFSGQHTDILESVLVGFGLEPDYDLRIDTVARDLGQSVAWLLDRLDRAIGEAQPNGVIVQGDTSTAFAGALAAFYRGVPSFHVEAGLRTHDPLLPFPEEMNRRLIARMAALHFAPTERAREHLLAEGIEDPSITVTGNTVVDALQLFSSRPSDEAEAILGRLRPGARMILVTLHRRENWDRAREATDAVRKLLMTEQDVDVVWILHRNTVREHVLEALTGIPNAHLLEPQSYPVFVHLMRASHMILTDSGGVQEEAPVLGKPVLVLRDESEREEVIEAGRGLVVGCNGGRILRTCERLLHDREAYERMSAPCSPFGDGRASQRIVDALVEHFYGTLEDAATRSSG